jgi:WD40 repeat protein
MAFVDGESLARKIAAGPLPPRLAAVLIKKVTDAVAYAHVEGVVHRDLKPANVLVDDEGEPRITDFGLAKQIAAEYTAKSGEDAAVSLTATGQVLGTPSYMPPEQAGGQLEKVGPLSDVYSLGAILYCVLTGRPPFQAAGTVETLIQVLKQEPLSPRLLNPKVPRDLETICLKCLEKEPGKRYAGAAALADDLGRFLRQEPIAAQPITSWQRTVKWARRRPAIASLLAVILLATVSLVTGDLWFTARLRTQRDYAESQKDIAQQREETARERLWESLKEQARAERLSGNRQRSLDVIAEAARMRSTMDLRQEAIQTITNPGIRLLHQIPVGYVNSMKFSSDGAALLIHGQYEYGSQMTWTDVVKKLDSRYQFIKAYEVAGGRKLGEKDLPAERATLGIGVSAFPFLELCALAPYVVSPSAPLVALGSNKQDKVRIWDYSNDKDVAVLEGHGRIPVLFSPDGMLLTVFTPEPALTNVWELRPAPSFRRSIQGAPVAFLSYDELLVDGGYGGNLRRVNVKTGEERVSAAAGMVLLAASPDGRLAVRAALKKDGPAGPASIWDLASGREVATLPRVDVKEVLGLQFSPDGRYCAFDQAEHTGVFDIWDQASGKLIEGQNGVVSAAGNFNLFQRGAFSPNGTVLATYAQKEKSLLHLRDVDARRTFATLRESHSPVWSADGRLLATIAPGEITRPDGSQYGGDRTFVRVWEVSYPTPVVELGKPVRSISLSPIGARFAANNAVWETRFDQLHSAIRPSEKQPAGVVSAFDAKGRLWTAILSVEPWEDKPFVLHQLVPGERTLVLQKPRTSRPPGRAGGESVAVPKIESLRFAARGNVAMMLCQLDWKTGERTWSSSFDTILVAWDLSRDLAPTVVRPTAGASCLSVSLDGKMVATADRGVEIWDLATQKRTAAFKFAVTSNKKLQGAVEWTTSGNGSFSNIFPIQSVLISPDGSRVFAGAGNGRVCVGDLSTGREVAVWEGHNGVVRALAVSPDGVWLASGGDDQTIRLWDTSGGRELAHWESHDEGVTALAFCPDGKHLVSGSADGTIKLWDIAIIRRGLAALRLDW